MAWHHCIVMVGARSVGGDKGSARARACMACHCCIVCWGCITMWMRQGEGRGQRRGRGLVFRSGPFPFLVTSFRHCNSP